MISQASALQAASQYAPCLAAAFSGLLPAHTGVTARSAKHNSSRQAVAAASNCVAMRSINSKDHDADDKLGRPTTPWVRQVISGVDLMRHPKYNKGETLLLYWGRCRGQGVPTGCTSADSTHGGGAAPSGVARCGTAAVGVTSVALLSSRVVAHLAVPDPPCVAFPPPFCCCVLQALRLVRVSVTGCT